MEGTEDAEGGFSRLEPVSKRAMCIGNSITAAIAIAAFIAFFRLSEGNPWREWALPAAALLLAIAVLYLLLSPPVFYAHYRYMMAEDRIEVRRGVVVRSHTVVPIERIHQVEVRKGPILRAYGLADLTVTTAGGAVTLEYLEEGVAEGMASVLNERIAAMLRARE